MRRTEPDVPAAPSIRQRARWAAMSGDCYFASARISPVRANPRGFSSLLAAAWGLTGGSPPRPGAQESACPCMQESACRRAQTTSKIGGDASPVEPPAWAIVPRGASPVPSRRRCVCPGDGRECGRVGLVPPHTPRPARRRAAHRRRLHNN